MWQRGRGKRSTSDVSLQTMLQPRQRHQPISHEQEPDNAVHRTQPLAINYHVQAERRRLSQAQQQLVALQTTMQQLDEFKEYSAGVRCWRQRIGRHAKGRISCQRMSWQPQLQHLLQEAEEKRLPIPTEQLLRWQETMMQTINNGITVYNMRRITDSINLLAEEIPPFQTTLQDTADQQTITVQHLQQRLEAIEIAASVVQDVPPVAQQVDVQQALEQLPQDILDWQHNKYPNTLARFRVWCRLTDTRDALATIKHAPLPLQQLHQQLSTATRNWMDPDAASADDREQIQQLLERIPGLQHAFHELVVAEQAADLQQVLAQRRTPR